MKRYFYFSFLCLFFVACAKDKLLGPGTDQDGQTSSALLDQKLNLHNPKLSETPKVLSLTKFNGLFAAEAKADTRLSVFYDYSPGALDESLGVIYINSTEVADTGSFMKKNRGIIEEAIQKQVAILVDGQPDQIPVFERLCMALFGVSSQNKDYQVITRSANDSDQTVASNGKKGLITTHAFFGGEKSNINTARNRALLMLAFPLSKYYPIPDFSAGGVDSASFYYSLNESKKRGFANDLIIDTKVIDSSAYRAFYREENPKAELRARGDGNHCPTDKPNCKWCYDDSGSWENPYREWAPSEHNHNKDLNRATCNAYFDKWAWWWSVALNTYPNERADHIGLYTSPVEFGPGMSGELSIPQTLSTVVIYKNHVYLDPKLQPYHYADGRPIGRLAVEFPGSAGDRAYHQLTEGVTYNISPQNYRRYCSIRSRHGVGWASGAIGGGVVGRRKFNGREASEAWFFNSFEQNYCQHGGYTPTWKKQAYPRFSVAIIVLYVER